MNNSKNVTMNVTKKRIEFDDAFVMCTFNMTLQRCDLNCASCEYDWDNSSLDYWYNLSCELNSLLRIRYF